MRRFAHDWKVSLGLFSVTNLAMIVWQSLSGARDVLFEQQAQMVISVVLLTASTYLTYLFINWLVVWHGMRLPLREAISVIIMARCVWGVWGDGGMGGA